MLVQKAVLEPWHHEGHREHSRKAKIRVYNLLQLKWQIVTSPCKYGDELMTLLMTFHDEHNTFLGKILWAGDSHGIPMGFPCPLPPSTTIYHQNCTFEACLSQNQHEAEHFPANLGSEGVNGTQMLHVWSMFTTDASLRSWDNFYGGFLKYLLLIKKKIILNHCFATMSCSALVTFSNSLCMPSWVFRLWS